MARQTRIEGLDRLSRKLAAMPPQLARAISTAIETNATEMASESKRIAQGFRLTGDLEGSIGWQWTPVSNQSDETRGSVKGAVNLSADVFAGRKGGKGFHAGFVEFGTVNAPAQPFFFPVYRLNSRRYKARISRELNKAIKAMSAGPS